MPHLYIITGSNGAGKSTIGPNYLPEDIIYNNIIFNGDVIRIEKLKEIFPSKTRSSKYARKEAEEYVMELFENQVENALRNNQDFIYEGHFTNDETWEIPRKFRQYGYTTHLLFLGLKNIEVSEARVAERVLAGGHHVEKSMIEQNFYGNLQQLNIYFGLFDELIIIDTTEIEHKILYKITNGIIEYKADLHEMPDWYIKFLGNL